MERRIRVLHIVQSLNYGGMERLIADLVRRVDPDRFESHVLALQYLGRFSEGLDQFATLHVADPLPRYSMVWPGPLIRQIRRIGPDVVHSHSGVWYKGSLAARRAGVRRVVHTEHGRGKPDPWEARVLDGLASRRTDRVVAVSDVLAGQLAATVVRHPERIRVIRNGVDTLAYRPRPDRGAVRRELGLAPEIPILGSIGRLEQIKGFDVMLEAFAKLRSGWSGGPAPVLVVAGDGAERPRLAVRIGEHALQGEVHLLGWRDDVHALHESFTLYTMSSRSEGTSLSLLEAMSAGLCPVVTDVGGNAAVLGPELGHRLVPSEDAAALAAAWHDALLDRSRREQDSLAARRRVEEVFGIDAMVRAYETLYATPMET
jgi:glycosyltransferase involved in cell wall biosynthesis